MLARIRKSMEEKDQGFTLIELLVVIIIIGILAAIAIPVFLNQRKKGVDASMKSDLRTVSEGLETYYTDSQAYPAAADFVTSTAGEVTIKAGAAGDVVKLSPGNAVAYTLNTAGNAFCVKASNAKGSNDWYYISSKGGLQPNTTTQCPAAGAF